MPTRPLIISGILGLQVGLGSLNDLNDQQVLSTNQRKVNTKITLELCHSIRQFLYAGSINNLDTANDKNKLWKAFFFIKKGQNITKKEILLYKN